MARKPSARSKQNAELMKQMRTGPFKFSDVVTTHIRTASGAYTDLLHPYRMPQTRFDETDHDQVRGVIDCEHARAIVNGRQTASQMGYGVYDIDVHVIYSTEALNPDTTENGLGEFALHYFTPTPLRLDALRALKDLERLDDSMDVFTSGQEGEAKPDTNPLLSVDIDTNAGAILDGTSHPTKGARIIRFGWSGQTSPVVRQSALTVNLNPAADDDVADLYETQYYVLTGGDSEHFAILDRMEHAVNPMVEDGQRMVQEEWQSPVTATKVLGQTTLRAPLAWGIADSAQGTANQITASFQGVTALGGLVGFTIPSWTQQGTGNNDMDIVVTVKGRKWVPLA